MIKEIEEALSIYPIYLELSIPNYNDNKFQSATISFTNSHGITVTGLIKMLSDITKIPSTNNLFNNIWFDSNHRQIDIKDIEMMNDIVQFVSNKKIKIEQDIPTRYISIPLNNVIEVEEAIHILTAIIEKRYTQYTRKKKIVNILSDLE